MVVRLISYELASLLASSEKGISLRLISYRYISLYRIPFLR